MVLEIVTGFMVGLLFVVAVFTIVHKWKRRPSIIIPWKKSSSSKDNMTMYIGRSIFNVSILSKCVDLLYPVDISTKIMFISKSFDAFHICDD